jgi:LysM repeat protein
MKKIIKLTESDLTRIIKRVIEEQTTISKDEIKLGKETGCYTVKQNETALSIAKKFGITLDDLISLNGINPNHIKPGQKLRVQNRTTFKGC